MNLYAQTVGFDFDSITIANNMNINFTFVIVMVIHFLIVQTVYLAELVKSMESFSTQGDALNTISNLSRKVS